MLQKSFSSIIVSVVIFGWCLLCIKCHVIATTWYHSLPGYRFRLDIDASLWGEHHDGVTYSRHKVHESKNGLCHENLQSVISPMVLVIWTSHLVMYFGCRYWNNVIWIILSFNWWWCEGYWYAQQLWPNSMVNTLLLLGVREHFREGERQ